MDIEKIKEVSIIDYARDSGFTPMKIGNWYTLKEHDSVRIDPVKNIFIQNSTGRGGSVIDFAMNFDGLSLPEAIKQIYEHYHIGQSESDEEHRKSKKTLPDRKTKLKLPEKDVTMKNVFAYLVKTRNINKDIVEKMVKDKMLYQDNHKNCVFVSYKEQLPVFGCIRGTNTYKRFVADVSGSDYEYMFYINNNSEKLILTESVIDALSVMSLKKEAGDQSDKYDYLALAGVGKWEKTIDYHTNSKAYKQIYLALDNDEAGKKIAADIEKHLFEKNYAGEVILDLPEEKDWNEQLVKEVKNELRGTKNDIK